MAPYFRRNRTKSKNLRHLPLSFQFFKCYEWAMNNSPSVSTPDLHPQQEEEERDNEQKQEQEENATRCEWEFRLSSVVSPARSASEISDAIGAVEFDPTDRLLATGGIARKIRIYALPRLLLPPPKGGGTALSDHSAACRLCICAPAKLSSLRWRPDSAGRTVASGDYDGVVTEYDVERGVVVFERDEHAGRRVWSLDYTPSGDLGASASDDSTVQLWDPRCVSGDRVAVARTGGAVCAVAFDPEGGPWVAAGSADRHAYVFDLRAMAAGPAAALAGHGRTVTYVRWAPQGSRRVVTSGTDGSHRMWEWTAEREERAYRGHACARSFVGMAVWGGAGLIGSGSESNEVFVYDLRWAEPIWVRRFGSRGEGFVGAVGWRRAEGEESALAAGGSDGVLQVFVGGRKRE